MRTIDMDTHFAPKDEWDALPAQYSRQKPFWLTDDEGRYTLMVNPGRPDDTLAHRAGALRPASTPRLLGNWNPEERLRDMDTLGVDVQMLCPEFPSYCFEMDADLTAALAHSSNTAVGKVLREHPDRFVGSAIVPTQNIRAALDEAEHALELGYQSLYLKGAQGGMNLSDFYFWPLWDFCNKHDLPLMVHSTMQDKGCAVHNERLGEHWSFSVGCMTDYFFHICSLIYDGVFDAYPNLRFCFAEVGATWIPWLWDRMALQYDVRPGTRRATKKHPTDYLVSNVYVNVDPTERALGFVCENFSSKNLLLGTDYPHGGVPGRGAKLDAIKATHLDLMLEREDVSQESKEDIFERNALRFLGGRFA